MAAPTRFIIRDVKRGTRTLWTMLLNKGRDQGGPLPLGEEPPRGNTKHLGTIRHIVQWSDHYEQNFLYSIAPSCVKKGDGQN